MLLSIRLVRFQEMLIKSERTSINLLAKINAEDSRTVHGNNLKNIARNCSIDNNYLRSCTVKQNMKYHKVPTTEEWKIPLVNELIEMRNEDIILSNSDNNELNEMSFLLTTS